LVDGKIVAGHSLFRGLVAITTVVAMPGGLTRNSTVTVLLSPTSWASVKTRVLSAEDEQEQPVFLQLNTDIRETKQLKRSLPSHTAENLLVVIPNG
jgi:hypothetical protein